MSTKLIYGKYLVTDADHVIPSGAVFIQNDEIASVGCYADLKDMGADEVIGSSDYLITPGFVNAHGHGRGISDFQFGAIDDTLETWKYRALPDFNRYYDTLWNAMRLLKSGVTTTMYNHTVPPEKCQEDICSAINAYLEAGIRVAFAPTLANQNTMVYEKNDEFVRSLPSSVRLVAEKYLHREAIFNEAVYFETIARLIEDFQSGYIKIIHGPLAPQWCRDETLEAIRKSATKLGIRIHIHVLQTLLQKLYGLRKYGKSLLEHLYDLGFLGSDVTCGHAVWLTERDIELLAETGASTTHHPSCNLRISNGISPVFYLLQKGIKVGIGIDDKGLSDDSDFIEEMRLASKLNRISTHYLESHHIQPKDCFRMGTDYGAEILGFSQVAGTIQKGKKADIVLIDLNRIGEPFLYPEHNAIDALIYRGRNSDVDTVVVGGEILVRNCEFTKIDQEEVRRKLQESISFEISEVAHRRELMRELKKHTVLHFKDWYQDIDKLDFGPYYWMNNRY